jgi:hypothetical protein
MNGTLNVVSDCSITETLLSWIELLWPEDLCYNFLVAVKCGLLATGPSGIAVLEGHFHLLTYLLTSSTKKILSRSSSGILSRSHKTYISAVLNFRLFFFLKSNACRDIPNLLIMKPVFNPLSSIF